jgi:endonuclease G
MKRFFAALLLILCANAFAVQPAPLALDQCKGQAVYGFPTYSKQDVTLICREGYLTAHNNKAKIPLYSAYLMTPEHATGCSSRDSSFEVDRSLPPSVRSGNKDYAKSGYDIGHMVSAEDLKYTPVAQAVAALLSNAAPQLPEFNRGVWKKLEDTSRGWALSRNHSLQVYVAPIVNTKQDVTIGKGRVFVPRGFVKILIDTTTQEVQVFRFKHEGSKEPLDTFITSLAEAQRETGVQFPMPPKPVFGPWKIELKSNQRAKAAVCSLK